MGQPIIRRSELENYISKALSVRFSGCVCNDRLKSEIRAFLDKKIADLASVGVFVPKDLKFDIIDMGDTVITQVEL